MILNDKKITVAYRCPSCGAEGKTEGAGMRRIVITPHLSGLKYVKVNFPTACGVVTVEHTLQDNGEVKTTVNAPDGIEVVY